MKKILSILVAFLLLGTATVSALELYQGIDGQDVGWQPATERGQTTCWDKRYKHNIGWSTNKIDQERFLNCLRSSKQTPEVVQALQFWSDDDMRAFAHFVAERGSGRNVVALLGNTDVISVTPAPVMPTTC